MNFYGFLSNGQTAALVRPDASIDWLPFPRFDSPSVFTRILGGPENGFFTVAPQTEVTSSSQYYIEGTNILKTVFETDGGRMIVRDYLAVGRPELRRLIESQVGVVVEIHPAFEYGLVTAAPRAIPQGAVFENPFGGETLAFVIIAAGEGGEVEADPAQGIWHLPPGRYDLILRHIGDGKRDENETVAALLEEAQEMAEELTDEVSHRSFERNVRHWRHIHRPPYEGPYKQALERSLLVLHGLTYRTTGAIIAAPTTSLPETIGEERQWDYRFSWIRDGAYTVEAFLRSGDLIPARRFLDFLLNCCDLQGKPFQAPFFHVDGTLIRGERELGWLRGFRDSRPCREGNAATLQTQMDVEGDFLWGVYLYYNLTKDRIFLDAYWDVIRVLVNWVKENYRLKDASLWEFRGRDDHYTHSKLMCWVALHYGAILATETENGEEAATWGRAADDLAAEIRKRAVDAEEGIYVQAYGSKKLDAALLLMPLYGFLDVNDPVFSKTLEAIEARLVDTPWVYRYETDMLGKPVHPFVIATSWLARVWIRKGHVDRAKELLDGLLAMQTDLGLLGEHADVDTGEPRGNFPQAFSHLGVVLTILELQEVEAQRAVASTT